jgi:hypothetical protein
MKSQFKTAMLSALFGIVGLCATLSTASAESRNAQVSQDLPLATYMLAFPQLTSGGGAKEKPLLLPGKEHKEFSVCKSTTKNEYFEFAIIFNDKLQELIYRFSADERKTPSDHQLTKIAKVN